MGPLDELAQNAPFGVYWTTVPPRQSPQSTLPNVAAHGGTGLETASDPRTLTAAGGSTERLGIAVRSAGTATFSQADTLTTAEASPILTEEPIADMEDDVARGEDDTSAGRPVGATTDDTGIATGYDVVLDIYRRFHEPEGETDSVAEPEGRELPALSGSTKRTLVAIGAAAAVAAVAVAALAAGHTTRSASAPAPPASAPAATPSSRYLAIMTTEHAAVKRFLIALGPAEALTPQTGQQPEVLASAQAAAVTLDATDASLAAAPWPVAAAGPLAGLRAALRAQADDLRAVATTPPQGFMALIQKYVSDGGAVDATFNATRAAIDGAGSSPTS